MLQSIKVIGTNPKNDLFKMCFDNWVFVLAVFGITFNPLFADLYHYIDQ